MADKRYTVSEVLELLEGEELLEDDVSDIVCTVDLNAESEDSGVPEGDGTDCDGSAVLDPSEFNSFACLVGTITSSSDCYHVANKSFFYELKYQMFSICQL